MRVRIKRVSLPDEEPRVMGYIYEQRVREGDEFEISDNVVENIHGFQIYQDFSWQIMEPIDDKGKVIENFQWKWKKGSTPTHLKKEPVVPIAPPMEKVR